MNLLSTIEKQSHILKSFFWRAVQIVGKQGVSFVIFFIASRSLPVSEFGLYNYVLALIMSLVIISDFGLSSSASVYATRYQLTDQRKLKQLVYNIGLGIVVLGFVALFLAFLFGYLFYRDKLVYIAYVAPLIFLIPLTSLYDGVYRGLKRFRELSLISITSGTISLGISVFLISKFGLQGAFFAQVAYYFIFLIMIATNYQHYHFKLNKDIIKEVGKYSIYFGLASLFYFLYSRIDVLLMGHFTYLNEIATYETLNKLFGFIMIPFSILGQVIAPDFSRLFVQKSFEQIRRKYIKYATFFVVFSFLVCLLCYFLIPFIVKLFFGSVFGTNFESIFVPTLLTYFILLSTVGINSGIIVSTNQVSIMTYINIIIGVVNVVLALLLQNNFAYVGIIMATFISNFLGVITLNILFYHKIKRLSSYEKL